MSLSAYHEVDPGVPGRAAARPSRSIWPRVRFTVTAGLFTVATVAGVMIGLHGASVSPVAPATPVAGAVVTPAGNTSTTMAGFHHGHGPHR